MSSLTSGQGPVSYTHLDVYKRQAAAAAATAAAHQEQALGQLATLRNTSVELERQRQDGLQAIEQARIAEEARRKAEEAARQAAAQALSLIHI